MAKRASKKLERECAQAVAKIMAHPGRSALASAVRNEGLAQIEEAWFAEFDRCEGEAGKARAERLRRDAEWLIEGQPGDEILRRYQKSREREGIDGALATAAFTFDSLVFASPLEAALRLGRKALFHEMCAALASRKGLRGRRFNAQCALGDIWRLWRNAERSDDDCSFFERGIAAGGVMFNLLLIPFVTNDGDAYMALLRAGADELEFLNGCREFFRENAVGEVSGALTRLGLPAPDRKQWAEFWEHRVELANTIDSVFEDLRSSDGQEDRLRVEDVLQRAPSIGYFPIGVATELGDIALVERLFALGGNPNDQTKHGIPLFAALGCNMDEKMFSAWLNAGASPTMFDDDEPFGNGMRPSPLYQFVWSGREDLVERCLASAREPIDLVLRWTDRDGRHFSCNVLAELARERAGIVPERSAEFERLASLLEDETRWRLAEGEADEIGSGVRIPEEPTQKKFRTI